jgi:outer membrane protein OmpA-like peptidoglycan-associated protein
MFVYTFQEYRIISEFKNISKNKKYDWLKIGIPEQMNSFLYNVKDINLIERNNLNKILQEQQLKQSGITKEGTVKIGKIIGASHIITGSYHINNTEITINARMINTETAKLLRVASITGEIENINSLIQKVVLNLSGKNSYVLSDEEKQQIAFQGSNMMKKIEAISNGELSIYEGNFDSARKFYQEALNDDPDNESIKAILKDIDVSLKAIAIVDFKNNNADSQYDVFSKSIPENITSLMVKKTGLPFTERLNIKSALKEMQLPLQGLIDPKTAPQLGKIIGASQLISGSFDILNDKITIHARLIDTETGKNIFAHSETGDINHTNEIETIIVDKIIESLANVLVANNPIKANDDSTTVASEIDKALKEGRKEASFTLEESIVSFEFAKANLTTRSFITLKEIATVLNYHPEYRVYILGHTDNVGTGENNKKLSKKRANSVLNKFVEYGVTINRLNSLGEGENDPIATNDTDEGRSKNRRVGLLFKIISGEKQNREYSILKAGTPSVE